MGTHGAWTATGYRERLNSGQYPRLASLRGDSYAAGHIKPALDPAALDSRSLCLPRNQRW
ncbi:MAG: hypothetical protein RR326_10395 [Stenotrophomonas sp.]